jgi:hypothetical protein
MAVIDLPLRAFSRMSWAAMGFGSDKDINRELGLDFTQLAI